MLEQGDWEQERSRMDRGQSNGQHTGERAGRLDVKGSTVDFKDHKCGLGGTELFAV